MLLLRKLRSRKLNRSQAGNASILLLLCGVAAFMALPLVFSINNAFKPMDEIFLFPPNFWVRNPVLDNFDDLLNVMSGSWVPFSRYFFNTLLLTATGTAGHIFLASMAAYALAKHVFPGGKAMFGLIVLSLMFSAEVTAIPNYMIMSWLGWINTYQAVIIPAFVFPLGLFLMKQFMEGVPDAVLEAARIDGASEYQILWRLVMPMVTPAWLTLTLFSIQALWGTTGGIFIYSEELKTLPYALGQILAGGIARTGVAAAAGVLMMAVPIGVFLLTQSRVIETMSSSGLKE